MFVALLRVGRSDDGRSPLDLYNAAHFKKSLYNYKTTKRMDNCPKLLPVPNMLHHLTIKATTNGITLLKEGRFKKRYTGSKTAAVDINGKFYSRSGDLKKILAAGKDPGPARHKKAPESLQTEAGDKNQKDTEDNKKQLSTPTREYFVNKNEVRSRLLAMINSQQGKSQLYFWTVTFPKGIADNIAYQAFNTWLTTLRQKKILKNYLWVAERQENKTIHFHIAIPHRMPVKVANGSMRTVLTSLAKQEKIPFNKWQCKKYNGVDIAKNRKTGRVTNFAIKKGRRALANYLTKYCTKNDSGFPHLAWHNSRGFSALFTGVTMTVDEFKNAGFMDLILYRAVISNEFFSFYPWRGDPPDSVVKHLYDLNSFVQSLN